MKRIFVLFIAVITAALLMGCGSAPASQSTTPSWLAEITPNDEVWGIGFAKLQNDSLAMQTATTRAQTETAQQIGTLVQAMLTDYANESGLANDPRSLMAIENIQRNIVNMNLSNSTINKREKMADGTWWVRVSVKKADAMRQISSIVNNEAADYAEFRADQALRQLEYQLNNTQTKPTPLGE